MSDRRGSPWRWPASSAVAVTLLLLFCIGVPSRWIKAFFSPLGTLRKPIPVADTVLYIMPYPEIEIIPSELPPAKPERRREQVPESWRPDPAWWNAVWLSRLQVAASGEAEPVPIDTLPAMPFWLSPTVAITNDAFVDTSRAHKLTLYMLREREDFLALKPVLLGRARQRLYKDLMNTTARLYDEFLYEEISVPDPDREPAKPRAAKQSDKLVDAR